MRPARLAAGKPAVFISERISMVTIADFDQDKFTATDQTRCIAIRVPDDDSYLPLLAGLLALPSYAKNYQDPDSDQAQGVADIWRDAYIETDWEGCMPPTESGNQTRVSFWHRLTNVTTGNALQIVYDTSQFHSHYARQNVAAVGDDNYQDVWLPAGQYQIRVLCLRNTSCGRLSVFFQYQPDLSTVTAMSAVEMYLAGSQYNSVLTGSFALTKSGQYRVFWQVPSKIAASSGYNAYLTVTDVWKTAD